MSYITVGTYVPDFTAVPLSETVRVLCMSIHSPEADQVRKERMEVREEQRKEGRIGERKKERKEGWMDGRKDGWKEGRKDGWKEGRKQEGRKEE